MRPFEIDLLEAVPVGEPSALNRQFNDVPIPTQFKEESTELTVEVSPPDAKGFRTLTIKVPATAGGFVAVTADARLNNLPLMRKDAGSHYETDSAAGTQWTPVLANQLYYKTSWQAWRTKVDATDRPRQFSLKIKADAPADAEVKYEGHLIPR